jgi:hypothetical protein
LYPVGQRGPAAATPASDPVRTRAVPASDLVSDGNDGVGGAHPITQSATHPARKHRCICRSYQSMFRQYAQTLSVDEIYVSV